MMTDDYHNSHAADLPHGWVWTTLGEACDIVMGQSPPSESYNTEGIGLPFYQGKAEFGDLYPKPVKWCSQPNKIAEAGDVLISVRAPVGPTNLCEEESCIGRGLAAVRPLAAESRYVLHALRNTVRKLAEQATGTTFAAISGTILRGHEIPLAPLHEQHRIVAKIEELFTRLDAGVAALKRMQANLKRYKAAVLKAACEGKLVPQDPNDEPASELLKRILAERRAKWEAGLRAKGKDPKKAKYVEPKPTNVAELPTLPEGWCWMHIGTIFDVSYGLSESLSKTEPNDELDIPVVRIPNVTEFGGLDLSELKYFPLDVETRQRLLLQKGDVLFNWRNAPKWIGRTTVFDRDGEFVNASFLLKLRPHTLGYSHFVAIYLNHLRLQGYFLTIVNNAVNQANFNASRTAQVEVPLPPLAEQHRIMAEVERRLSVVQEMEAAIAANLARAERLRQSILKRAFEGRLVPQDPDDEPASLLLERIRQQRTTALSGHSARDRNGSRAATGREKVNSGRKQSRSRGSRKKDSAP